MKYIDRRFLFPVAAVATAWAQQPADPAAAQAEAALRARVDEFYKLQVDKKFRQAESFVAEDSKDIYYDRAKQNIHSFSLQTIDLSDNNTRAKVTVKGKITMVAPIGAMDFDLLLSTKWKIENGQWVWYVDPETSGQTPFGTIRPPAPGQATGAPALPPAPEISIQTLRKQVTMDRNSVTLNATQPEQTVIFTNHMPGSISLELARPQLTDISVELEKTDLKAGESGKLRFRLMGRPQGSGVVTVTVSPLNETFEIKVLSN